MITVQDHLHTLQALCPRVYAINVWVLFTKHADDVLYPPSKAVYPHGEPMRAAKVYRQGSMLELL